MEYIRAILSKYFNSINDKIKFNEQLQQFYDPENIYDMLTRLQEYNYNLPIPYLATGLSCYFNEQIDKFGLSNFKIAEQDKDDAKFIANCFGKKTNYGENNISTLYTTLLGTTEFNYGMQTFPAGIFEDVFQCSPNHDFPIQPKVGESEPDFYCRILEYHISKNDKFPLDKKDEVLLRAKRLATHFCSGKNRVYLIPFNNVLNNKASFGDVHGLRDGKLTNEEMKSKLDSLPTFERLLEIFNISINEVYINPNMTSEYGIAIYESIQTKGITYIEVDRIYDLMQEKAAELGIANGDIIPADISGLTENMSTLK